MNKKRGQVTIFIILAILLVVGILAAIVLMGGKSSIISEDVNPREFVQRCVRDAVEDSIVVILKNGGEIVPSHSLMYQGEEHNYLCYQGDFYQGCYNVHPMLEYQIENEIMIDTQDEVLSCFTKVIQDYEAKGFEVNGGDTTYSIDLLPGYVEINLNKRLSFSKDGSPQTFDKFGSKVISSLYNLMRIAREVVNSESQYCSFEYNGYMILYPRYDIRRIDYSDTKIYRLIDRISGEEFRFAVRSCVFAPGI
jgi:hypothetical protein